MNNPSLALGSAEHKRVFCGVLLDTFNPYKPSIVAWPKLSQDAAQRLTALPFWDVAVQTEGYASSRMQAMADTVRDPIIKEAIALNAFEEGRHKLVIRNMLRAYGIPLAEEGDYNPPASASWAFLRTGYGECLDSFFAFGLFKMARDSGYFPPELTDVFEPVVQEEARHILFFVNWVAWQRANLSPIAAIWFHIKGMTALMMAGLSRLSLAFTPDGGKGDSNFVAAGGQTLTVDLSPRKLLEVCLAEDTRRMAMYDPRLPRPQIMPFVARLALKFMKK